MPWLDYHLHVFRMKDPKSKRAISLGIPDEDGELNHKPCWDYSIADFFSPKNKQCLYEYDFGDGWMHEILLEGIHPKEKGAKYPRCIDGKRAGPPEDVGGPGGYERFREIIRDPGHEEHQEMLEWAKGLTGHDPFDPEHFDLSDIHFDNPTKRWSVAFAGGDVTPDLRCYGFRP